MTKLYSVRRKGCLPGTIKADKFVINEHGQIIFFIGEEKVSVYPHDTTVVLIKKYLL